MGFFLILAIISFICLIPFGIALSYFVLGLRNYSIGRKEKSRIKKISGMNAALFSLLGMIAAYFLWVILCKIFLSWEW